MGKVALVETTNSEQKFADYLRDQINRPRFCEALSYPKKRADVKQQSRNRKKKSRHRPFFTGGVFFFHSSLPFLPTSIFGPLSEHLF
jgi:hypothetical protein